MNENIDLTKILKNCPKETKLYSILHGDVEYMGISDKGTYRVEFKAEGGNIYGVTPDGRYLSYFNGDCILLPSKDQRDWSKFTAPWCKKEKFDPKTLQPFDKVLVRENYPTENWYAAYFSHIEYDVSKYDLDVYEETPEFIICTTGSSGFCYCIPYNDETKHLVGTEDEAPKYYRYWED